MRRLIRATTAAITCGVVLLGMSATPAQAAIGKFVQRNVAEPPRSPLIDPPNGICRVVAQRIRPIQIADNQTDTRLRLYKTNMCVGDGDLIIEAGDGRFDLGTAESLIAIKFAN